MPLSLMKFFLVKAKFLVLGYSAQVLDYQDFQITGHWITGTLLYIPLLAISSSS